MCEFVILKNGHLGTPSKEWISNDDFVDTISGLRSILTHMDEVPMTPQLSTFLDGFQGDSQSLAVPALQRFTTPSLESTFDSFGEFHVGASILEAPFSSLEADASLSTISSAATKRKAGDDFESPPSIKRVLKESTQPSTVDTDFGICPKCASAGIRRSLELSDTCNKCPKVDLRGGGCLRCAGLLDGKSYRKHSSSVCPNKEWIRRECSDKSTKCLHCHTLHPFDSTCFKNIGRCCEFVLCALVKHQSIRPVARNKLGFLEPGVSTIRGSEKSSTGTQEGTTESFLDWLKQDSTDHVNNLQALKKFLLNKLKLESDGQ